MKNFLPFLTLCLILSACSSVKKTQEAINYGNYDEAINIAIKNLRTNKTKKSNQPYVLMLQEAYAKVTEQNLEKIKFLKKEGNPANLEVIYNTYLNLNNRQEIIKPLLPLPILDKGKNAKFQFNDYSTNILSSKQNLSEYLYNNAENTIKSINNKVEYRNIYDDLTYLNQINPNYKNTNALITEVHEKGTDYIFISIQNKTNKVIPIKLEQDLLNFQTYDLNTFWTIYHGKKQPQINYNYEIELSLREIIISPEQIHEKEIYEEKQVKDGWKYAEDTEGNTIKDSLGKAIKVDKYKTVKSKVNLFTQNKSVQVIGQVIYFNLDNNQIIRSFPLESGFVFEHSYATYSGNINALSRENLDLVKYKPIPFPSNEQMIYDSGEGLKQQIKNIITSNNIF